MKGFIKYIKNNQREIVEELLFAIVTIPLMFSMLFAILLLA